MKNLYPRVEGKRGTGTGCENYAYFDKYMVTMGSWAAIARLFADAAVPDVPAPERDLRPRAFATTRDFHLVFLRAGDYSAQFDYDADTHYDCDGLGRVQRTGAPSTICLATPCAAKPNYSTEAPNAGALAIVPAGGAPLVPAGCGQDDDAVWADWKAGACDWTCRLTKDGLSSVLSGPGRVALQLPAFAYDGAQETEIVHGGQTLSVRYGGWVCTYATDGEIVDTGRLCCNRNGKYRVFEARGEKSLKTTVAITKETTCAN